MEKPYKADFDEISYNVGILFDTLSKGQVKKDDVEFQKFFAIFENALDLLSKEKSSEKLLPKIADLRGELKGAHEKLLSGKEKVSQLSHQVFPPAAFEEGYRSVASLEQLFSDVIDDKEELAAVFRLSKMKFGYRPMIKDADSFFRSAVCHVLEQKLDIRHALHAAETFGGFSARDVEEIQLSYTRMQRGDSIENLLKDRKLAALWIAFLKAAYKGAFAEKKMKDSFFDEQIKMLNDSKSPI